VTKPLTRRGFGDPRLSGLLFGGYLCSRQIDEVTTGVALTLRCGVILTDHRRSRRHPMATKGRKRRTRRKNKANHGKRPNAGRK